MNHEQQETERVLLKAISDYLQARGWTKDGPFWTHPELKDGGKDSKYNVRSIRFRAWDALSETRSRPMFFGGGLR
jgi:hypothetical protein